MKVPSARVRVVYPALSAEFNSSATVGTPEAEENGHGGAAFRRADSPNKRLGVPVAGGQAVEDQNVRLTVVADIAQGYQPYAAEDIDEVRSLGIENRVDLVGTAKMVAHCWTFTVRRTFRRAVSV